MSQFSFLVFILFSKYSYANLVGITYDVKSSRAIRDHTLFIYETINYTNQWSPILLVSNVCTTNEINLYNRTYTCRDSVDFSGLDTVIEGCQSVPSNFKNVFPEIHLVYFNHGPDFISSHVKLLQNKNHMVFDSSHSVDSLWTAPHYDWQSEYVKWFEKASVQMSAPYVWEPRMLELRQRGVRYHNGTNNRIGVYESNRGIYKMSLIPMMIVEALHKDRPVEYAESYGLQRFDTDVFRNDVLSQFHAPWVTDMYLAELPKQWAEQRIGTVVSHTLRCGLNNLWFEIIHTGIALVHNSKHLPDGCGYYYPGENITAGAEALRRAIETHNEVEAERHRKICLQPHSTSNPKNIAWYQRLLNKTLT